jgi:hypothetical protein
LALATPGGDRDVVVVGTHPLSRLYLRFHVSLLILWSFFCGLLINKALLLAGVDWMLVRYPLSLLAGYGAFFVGVRLWLAYVGAAPLWGGRKQAREAGDSGVDAGNVADVLDAGPRIGPMLKGGGGDFGGAGASASFGNASAESSLATPRLSAGGSRGLFSTGSRGSGGGTAGFALDLGDGDSWLVIVLLALAAALLCSVFGAVLYVVYSAPSMLADVAFSAMLAGGLVKSSRRWRDACWKTELLRATWVPFTIVLVLAVLTAGLAMHLFPQTRTFSELIHTAIAALG